MKIVTKCLIFLLLFLPVCVKGADFEIITYDVEANFSVDRTSDINEKYNIYFINDINKIVRSIDKKIVTIRPDKTKRITNGIISDINVLERNFTSTVKNNEKIIEINSEFKKDTVEEVNIGYNYNFGKDTGVGYDELFFEIADGNFDATISGLTFKITLPKSFDSSKIKFAYDSKYTLGAADVTYSIEENTIIGTLNRSLPSGTKFQIYVELPDGYFAGATDNYNYLMFLLLIFPIGTIIFAFMCLKKYKFRNNINIDISEEIPYNFSSAEIAYLYKGYLKEHDLMTILIDLANKGYIMFEELDDGYKLGRANSFKMTKLKDYDLDDAATKILFDKLFQTKDVIELSDIEYNLYDTLVEAKGTIDNKYNHKKIFFQDISKNKMILAFLAIVSIIAINAYSIYLYTSSIWFIPVISAVLIFGIYILFIVNTNFLVKLLFGLGLMVGSMYVGIVPIFNEQKTLIIYIIGMLLILISVYIYKILPYRTKQGNEYLGKVYGFKAALDNLPIAELDNRLKENPNYFYEMYPYMYVMDDLELWITKCSNSIKKYPDWYRTKEDFSIRNFEKFVKNMIFMVTQSMFKRQLEGQSTAHVEYRRDGSADWLEK